MITALVLLPFGALCSAATWYLLRRQKREQRTWIKNLSDDYSFQWQQFEAQHQKKFEDDYWNTSVNHPERLNHGG